MSGILLRLADLARDPEFHLDELLDVLRQVPDGYTTRRIDLGVGEDAGSGEPGWELDVAAGYSVEVNPAYQCGWTGEGDGPVLTAILSRLGESHGRAILHTASERHESPHVGEYEQTVWRVAVRLEQELPWTGEAHPRAGRRGEALNAEPGIAALIAYLRAWGVVE